MKKLNLEKYTKLVFQVAIYSILKSFINKTSSINSVFNLIVSYLHE